VAFASLREYPAKLASDDTTPLPEFVLADRKIRVAYAVDVAIETVYFLAELALEPHALVVESASHLPIQRRKIRESNLAGKVPVD
jgi:hypothetical protein